MATVEQGVQNLRHFIAQLVSANAALEQVTHALQASERDVSQLDGAAAEQGGGLNDDLEEIRSQLEAGQAGATKAVEDLAQEAGEAQQALESARVQVEQAARHFEDGARTLAADLDQEHGRLIQDGFVALGAVVDEIERELEGARTESGQAWTELEGAVRGFEAESQTAWDASDAALDQAAADAAAREASIETEASAGVQGLEALASELDGACAALDQELAAIHDGCVAGIDAEEATLTSAAQHLADEGATFVEAATAERLETPAATVEKESLEALQLEYSLVLVAVTTGLGIAGALSPLTEDLEKCEAIVAQVDRLLNAMA